MTITRPTNQLIDAILEERLLGNLNSLFWQYRNNKLSLLMVGRLTEIHAAHWGKYLKAPMKGKQVEIQLQYAPLRLVAKLAVAFSDNDLITREGKLAHQLIVDISTLEKDTKKYDHTKYLKRDYRWLIEKTKEVVKKYYKLKQEDKLPRYLRIDNE